MLYSVSSTPNFDKEVKRLSKKHASLKLDLTALVNNLIIKGTVGIPVLNNVYKIRMAISSTGKGKSAGARIYTLVQVSQNKVTLFSIYTKSEKSTLSDAEIKLLLAEIES